MTTIVFKQGILASDSSAVTGGSITHIIYQKKIHVSSCKRLAWGFSGQVIDPDYITNLERLLLAHVLELQAKFSPKLPFSDELKEIVGKRDFIIVTKDVVYIQYKSDDESYCVKLLPDEVVAIGTGRSFALAAMLKDRSAPDAVLFSMEHDYFTYHGEVLQIKQSSLKALPKEVE